MSAATRHTAGLHARRAGTAPTPETAPGTEPPRNTSVGTPTADTSGADTGNADAAAHDAPTPQPRDSHALALEVVRAGALTTVQDLGRAGHAHLGVPRSGALDTPAHQLANNLLANPDTAATLETTLTGCAVRALAPTRAVVTGAPCPVTVDGRPAPWGVPIRLRPGSVLEAGTATHGLRSYLAFSGGVATEPTLGSRATDLLSGLGSAPLRDGDRLPLGSSPAASGDDSESHGGKHGERHGGHHGAVDTAPWQAPPSELVLPVVLGPRDDWFTPAALDTLTAGDYRVSATGNRIGLHLDGPRLERSRQGELPSEGMPLGAIQVPAEGRPVVFLADHPVTGGYPVIGVVPREALPAAAQAAPGTPVRFVPARSAASGDESRAAPPPG